MKKLRVWVWVWYARYVYGMPLVWVWYGMDTHPRHGTWQGLGKRVSTAMDALDPRSTWLATLPSYLNLCLGMRTIEGELSSEFLEVVELHC